MKIVLIVVAIITLLIVVGLIYLQLRTNQAERDERQQTFIDGAIPNPLPDGFYKGKVLGYNGTWTGKTFDGAGKTGINNFSDGNRLYDFAFYEGTGLRDKQQPVIKIDYSQPSNPFWVRFITDEIVQTDQPDHFLGKIHVRLFGLIFTVGYFSLER